jgi:hypothetical protein
LTPAECETGDPRRGDDATGDGQAECLGLAIQVAPRRPAPRTHRARLQVDANSVHQGQVDDQSVVAGSEPGDVVSTAANGQQHIVVDGPPHAGDDIGGPTAPGDCGRFAVNHAVPDAPGIIVRRVLLGDEAIAELRSQVADRLCVDAPRGS